MAKKSKSKGNPLFSLLAIVFAGAVFGILAMPFVKASVSALGSKLAETSYSGYSLLDFEANSGMATVILPLVIFAGLLALVSLVKLLLDLGVVKNGKVGRTLGLVMAVLGLALVGAAIATMIVVPNNCNAGALGNVVAGGTKPQWLALILMLVDGLVATCVSLMSAKK